MIGLNVVFLVDMDYNIGMCNHSYIINDLCVSDNMQ